MSGISPRPEEALAVGQRGYKLWKKVLSRDSWARGIMTWAMEVAAGRVPHPIMNPIDELRMQHARGLISEDVMESRVLDVKIRTGEELTDREMELLKKITEEQRAAQEQEALARAALEKANGPDVDGELRVVETRESGRPESDTDPTDQGENDGSP